MKYFNTGKVVKNKTGEYYFKLCKIFYALGAPNYWYGNLGIPEYAETIHDRLVWIIDFALYASFVSVIGANFTQHNLSEKQKSDMRLMLCQPMWYLYIVVFSYYRKEVRILGYKLAVKLKKEYNDPQVEEEMMQCVKVYGGTFIFFNLSTLILYGFQGLAELILNGNNFVAVTPIWPDIHDPSTIGSVLGVAHYMLWWTLSIRVVTTAYLEVIMITSSLSHQYKNLCSYFRNLNTIFEDSETTQEEKDYTYEEAFILGIQLHNSTLRCKKLAEKVCYVVFSIQIFMNLAVISMMLQKLVNSDRTLSNLLQTTVPIGAILINTGSFWCSAGDVTIEASQLSTAMFESGWQHCRGRAALRARTLLGVAMWHSQRPVVLRCLGLIELSYPTYVKIVRFSYQVFSVLYSSSSSYYV